MRLTAVRVLSSLLQATPGFQYEARSKDALPTGFPENVKGIPYFLEDYLHPGVPEAERDSVDHIALAVQHFNIHVSAPPT